MREDTSATERPGTTDGSDGGWLDGDVHTDRRRAWLVTAAAVTPWVVVAVVMVLRSTGSETPPLDHAHLEDAAGVEPAVAATPGTAEAAQAPGGLESPRASPSGLSVIELRGDWRATPGSGGVGAIATAVARSWLTDVAPRLTAGGNGHAGEGLYAEHLVVEAVEQLDAQMAVATLLAVVLRDTDPLAVDVHRLAVPVHVGADQARPAGEPWWLPEPELDPQRPEWHPITDQADLLAAAEALAGAGYLDVSIESLEQSTSWPWRARVSARTPGGTDVTTPVLLRRHVEGFVVAGTVLGEGDDRGGRP